MSVSRSLGDHDLEPYVSSVPEVYRIDLTDGAEFLIVGCDGLWDVMTDDEAIEMASIFLKTSSVEIVSRRLRDIAYARGSTDNITVLVIKFLTQEEILNERVEEQNNCSCSIL